MRSLFSRRRARWAAPLAVAGAIALGSALSTVSAGASTPTLPPLSAAQVLAKAAHPSLGAFSGTVELTTNLGLPDLSAVTSNGGQGVQQSTGFDPTTLLTGDHSFDVWSNGSTEQRVRLTASMAETDFVRDGTQAWLYDSSSQQVTHLVGAAHRGETTGTAPSDPATAGMPTTPEQAAQRFLDHLDPSTTVTVDDPVDVAGRAAYQLSLAPKAGTAGASASTISSVSITVDSTTGAVLSFAVVPAGTTTPALKLAFTSLSPGSQSSSLFTPPTGKTTKTETVGGDHGDTTHAAHAKGDRPDGQQPAASGSPWAQVLTFHAKQLTAKDLHELDQVSTGVGSNRLVHSNVVNVLVEPDGTILAGFVQPSVLEADAAG